MTHLLAAFLMLPLSKGEQQTVDTKTIVAYMAASGPVDLPLNVKFPPSQDLLDKHFPENKYIRRPAEGGVLLVVDRSIPWLAPEADTAVLLREIVKRPNPFKPIKIGELSTQAREAAIRIIDLVQPKPLRAVSDDELRKSAISLNLSALFSEQDSERYCLPMMAMKAIAEDAEMIESQLAASPIPLRKPTERELAAMQNTKNDVVVRQYGGGANTGTYLVSAAEEFKVVIDELRKDQATSSTGLIAEAERFFSEYLGGLRVGGTSKLDGSGQIGKEFQSRYLSSWQINGFQSRDEAQSRLNEGRLYRLNGLLSLRWSTGPTQANSPTYMEVELFRLP